MIPRKENQRNSKYVNLTDISVSYILLGWNRRLYGKWGFLGLTQVLYSSTKTIKSFQRQGKFHQIGIL